MANGTDATEAAERPPTLLMLAVADSLKRVQHLEEASEYERMHQKFVQHLSKAGRKLETGSMSFLQSADAMADAAMSGIVTAFGDKEWLTEMDFTIPFTAAMRERFQNFTRLSHFEKAAADACEKAWDNKLAENIAWTCIQSVVNDKITRNKIYEAVDMSRKTAKSSVSRAATGMEGLETFMTTWINGTVLALKANTGGKPEKAASPTVLTSVFHSIVEKGGLPKSMTSVYGAPPADWPHVQAAVAAAYADAKAAPVADDEPKEPVSKRARTREQGYGSQAPSAEAARVWESQVRRMAKGTGNWGKRQDW